MKQQQTATLTAIFSDVLANLAFMFTDDSPAEPDPAERWLETTIGYEGTTGGGTLKLVCPASFGRVLAANLLGVDETDPQADEKIADAVSEFMNIVCGQVITALHGTEPVFDLTIPQTCELSAPPDLTPSSDPAVSDLTVEGHPVRLSYMSQSGSVVGCSSTAESTDR